MAYNFFFNKRLRRFIKKLYQNRSLYPHRFVYISFPERLPFTRHIKHTNIQFFFHRFCSSVQTINLILAKFMINMHLRSNNMQENDVESCSNECLYCWKLPNNLFYIYKNSPKKFDNNCVNNRSYPSSTSRGCWHIKKLVWVRGV